jgi:hypothetical protein
MFGTIIVTIRGTIVRFVKLLLQCSFDDDDDDDDDEL